MIKHQTQRLRVHHKDETQQNAFYRTQDRPYFKIQAKPNSHTLFNDLLMKIPQGMMSSDHVFEKARYSTLRTISADISKEASDFYDSVVFPVDSVHHFFHMLSFKLEIDDYKKSPTKFKKRKLNELNRLLNHSVITDDTKEHLRKKLLEMVGNYSSSVIVSQQDVLALLKQKKIKLWSEKSPEDPTDPMDFYEKYYKEFKGHIYQFILREYDEKLIRAMESRIAYRRRKGEKISLKDYVPPKKERIEKALSTIDFHTAKEYANLNSAIYRRK